MKWPWQKTVEDQDSKDVDVLLAQAHADSPTSTVTGTFEMVVEDVFSIQGRGTVVTGKVSAGSLRVGQRVQLVRAGVVTATTSVTGIEQFRKVIDTAVAGDFVGLLLDGVSKADVLVGDVLSG